jgi:hypothetical protein
MLEPTPEPEPEMNQNWELRVAQQQFPDLLFLPHLRPSLNVLPRRRPLKGQY